MGWGSLFFYKDIPAQWKLASLQFTPQVLDLYHKKAQAIFAKLLVTRSEKTKNVSQAEQQPYGCTKHHWETIGIPKNA